MYIRDFYGIYANLLEFRCSCMGNVVEKNMHEGRSIRTKWIIDAIIHSFFSCTSFFVLNNEVS